MGRIKWVLYVRSLAAYAIIALVIAMVAGAPVRADNKDSYVMGGTLTGTNGFYTVYVQDLLSQRGVYTATTGPSHPAGNGLNVLFGSGSPGTTFNTIRSYTTNTDYVQRAAASINPTVVLESFGAVAVIGTTGVRTTYTLPGPPTTPDALTIVQDVNVNGTGFADSTIEVTTRVTNTGAEPVQIGVRYLWDFQIGADDGPTFQQQSPAGAVRILEADFLPPAFQSYRMVDNDKNPSPPTFFIFGTVTGPSGVMPTPTAPDELKYACWSSSVGTAFEYTVNPTRDIATTASDCRGSAGGDSAVLYYFGHDSIHAITIPAGQTAAVSASLFLTPPVVGVTGAPALSWAGLFVLGSLLAGFGGFGLSRRLAA